MFSIKISHKHDLGTISEMRDDVLNALANHDCIVFDVSDVDYLTTPLVQFFLSLGKTLQGKNKTFSFKNATPHFKEAITDFGCQDYLERAFQ